jgi:NodT family efflux transporter outer membrane factor (OMF) lipoprotein
VASGCAPSLADNPSREVRRDLPAAFPSAAAGAEDGVGQKDWRDFFQSPELQQLIELALENNQELNVRLQEIIIAQAEVGARRGEYLPRLSAGVNVGVEKVGEETSAGASDRANGLPQNLGNFQFGLLASWEVDVWGRLRNAAQAADYRALASVEAKNFMVTQLVAEIARSYYELIALDNQLEVLRHNIQIQTDALEVVRQEKQAARVTELAVQRFEAELLENKSRISELEQQRVLVENRINFLVGRYPQPVARNARQLEDPLPEVLQTGLPSKLLENRPDVRAAELQLEAAKMDVISTRKRFFPALSIEAGVGYRAFNALHLLYTPESLIYNLAGNLVAPLLNRAAIEADYRSANARQIQAVFDYERTLLQAFTDVSNQLATFNNLRQSYELRARQVEILRQSVEVSTVLFQAARADYVEVLLTRRDSLDAQLELIETKLRLLQAMVGLYQALGGGWRAPQASAKADAKADGKAG